MAIYEFECPNGHRTEKLCHSRDTNSNVCQCGELARRIMSAPASIVIKEAEHKDSGVPQWLNTALTNKSNELWDRSLARQGKKFCPEDIGEE